MLLENNLYIDGKHTTDANPCSYHKVGKVCNATGSVRYSQCVKLCAREFAPRADYDVHVKAQRYRGERPPLHSRQTWQRGILVV
jgi:hypothetical protein